MTFRRALLVAGISAVLATSTSIAAAHDRDLREGRAPETLYVGITSACANPATGYTSVSFTLATTTRHVWAYATDKGGALTQLGGGVQARVNGTWVKATTTSGGEGRLRFPTVPDADLLKVVYSGWTSPPTVVDQLNCV